MSETHAHDAHHDDHHDHHPTGLLRYLYSTNHKDIGTMYIIYGFVFGLVGFAMSMLIRIELAHPGAGNVEDLARMTDGDVIIAFSSRPYSIETVRLLRAAHQLKIKTIAITDTPSSPLVKYATVPVIVPTEKGKYLFRMGRTFSAIEAILETVFDDPAVEAHERIAYFADRMKAIRGYWEES